jgi:CHAD domain-containing protein
VLASQAEVLHDLRKHLKRVRYQAEFFLGCYAPAFADLIKDFQALQDILGQLQDLSVLRGFLTHTWREDWPETCPQLLHHLQQEQRKNWQQWLSAQQRYLDPQVRQTVRQGFLSLNLHPEPANLTARGSIT